ncbi:MAG: sugar phosphate isomerase/epimerase [Phycisphaeraceae bacterium]
MTQSTPATSATSTTSIHAEERTLTLTLCSIAFRNDPIEDIVTRAAALGFDGVEVFAKQIEEHDDEALLALRRLADEHRIALPVISPYFAFTRGQKEYDDAIATARRCVHAAQILGATRIRTFTDVAATGIGSDIATDAHWEQCVRGLRVVTALDRGLQFVVETHGHTLADTVDATLKLLERVDAPNLKVLYQPTTFRHHEGVDASFDALRPHTAHLHLQQQGTADGQGWLEAPGEIDYPAFFDRLKRSGYRGTVSLEYCFKGVTWERVEAGYRYLAKHLRD